MRDLVKTGLPIFSELLFVSLFGMVDMALLKPTGTVTIAAVGLTAEPMNLMEFAFWALQTAAVATLSGLFAKREEGQIRRLATAVLKLIAGTVVVLAVVAALFAPAILRLFGAMGDTLPTAIVYFRITLAAFVFRRLYNAMADMLKALGVPQWSFWLNLMSNAVNIVFDILLIYGIGPFPRLGAAGAAIATLLGCMTGFAFAIFVFRHRLRQLGAGLTFADFKASTRKETKQILVAAAPMVSEKIMIRVGVFLAVRRVAMLGAASFATYRILISLQMFAYLGAEALATTVLIFASRAYAKKDADEAKRYFNGALICTLGFALVCVAAFILFGRPLVGLYSNDPTVVAEGARVLLVICAFQPFQAVALLHAGAMRSCGLAKIPTVVTTIGIVVIRPILVYSLTPVLGVMGAWLAIAIDEIFRMLVLLTCRGRLWRAFTGCETNKSMV